MGREHAEAAFRSANARWSSGSGPNAGVACLEGGLLRRGKEEPGKEVKEANRRK